MQALIAAPAAPALLRAQQAGVPAPGGGSEAPAALDFAVPDVAAETVPQFFDDRQFATLRRLGELLEPPAGGVGAAEARAAEFLDFLLSQSPPDRQQLYLSGLDALEHDAQVNFAKSFAETGEAQAQQLLAALRQPWTYQAPGALAAFLREAKEDMRTATRNSKAWADAGRGGGGLYWLPVE